MISVRTRQLVFLFTLALCWVSNVCVAATPDDGDRLYVYTKPIETPTVYVIDDVEDITFNAGGLVVTTVSGTSTPYSFSQFRLITFDEDIKPITTGIEKTPLPSFPWGGGDNSVYDLQGRKIADDPSSLLSNPSFKPGVYIVNGKKVVIGK